MKLIVNPQTSEWESLTQRPAFDYESLTGSVRTLMDEVYLKGDEALVSYTKRFDQVEVGEFKVDASALDEAGISLSRKLKNSIQQAYQNIEKFHRAQLVEEEPIETEKGVTCWRKSVGIEKVGLYIPGGSAPLFSSILMLGIPAKIAGCREIILCTPPDREGNIHPAILYTAKLLGIDQVYKVGGAQAIAAMAYGTETIPQVYKIFGPGNQYVTRAKEIAQQQGTAIDMPAGPSELLVIADETCKPSYVVADLLSQAEHGADSQVILLTTTEKTAQTCLQEVDRQLEDLPRKEIALQALWNSRAIVLDSWEECIAFSNQYAPEHLILASAKEDLGLEKIINAGSVFVGNYSCESVGDYASGTNHTLPTNGFARNYSGVSVDSFVKKITFQRLTGEGLLNIGETVETMAAAEGLDAHKNAVSMRLKDLRND